MTQMAPLEDLWGEPGRLLEERLAVCPDDVDRMAVINRLLRRCLLRDLGDGHRQVFAAVRAIEQHTGVMCIDTLAEDLGLGQRSLERLFAKTLGITPKHYARSVRLNQTIGLLVGRSPGQIDWTSVANEVGCYDQAHLIHEFRAFTGMTPGDFIAIPQVGFTLAFGAVVMPASGS